jgi:predicted CXXCH cytochrome family protein
MPPGPNNFGNDLSGHHPVSFTYDSALATAKGELRDPTSQEKQLHLDNSGQLQCTSCHDPHNDQFGNFLLMDNSSSALCLNCHVPAQWTTSAHASSLATWNGTGQNPWPHTSGKTVAANGCENCHQPHKAGTKPNLLNFARTEDNCLVCHNGSVAAKNVASEFNKASVHSLTGATSARDISLSPKVASNEHVSCVDCHNPHATQVGAAVAGGVSGALTQVRGINASGGQVPTSSYEYEICFRCHANGVALASSMTARQVPQPNVRLQFDSGNRSYHPVLAVAKSGQDRTLVSPWTTASRMLCTDCHNNDQGPGARGSGPNGPHGSRYAPLLERNLQRTDFQPESATTYALCYKCHNQGVLMSDSLHSSHVRDQKTACTTCHDPHGVQTQTHLINFNTTYVTPSKGVINYGDLGGGQSTCTLTCHSKEHSGTSTLAIRSIGRTVSK